MASTVCHTLAQYYPPPSPTPTHVRETRSLELQTNFDYLDLEVPQHLPGYHRPYNCVADNFRTFDLQGNFDGGTQQSGGDYTFRKAGSNDKQNTNFQAWSAVSEVPTSVDVSTFTGDPITVMSDAGNSRSSSSSQDSDGPEAEESVLDETKPSGKAEIERVKSNYHLFTVQNMHPALMVSVARVTDVAVVGERSFLEDEDHVPPPLPRKMAIKRAKNASSNRSVLSTQSARRKMGLQTGISTHESEFTPSKEDNVAAHNCLTAHTRLPSPDVEEQPTSQCKMSLEFLLHAPNPTHDFVAEETNLQMLKVGQKLFSHDKGPSSVSSDSGTSNYSTSPLSSSSISPGCSPDELTITSSELFNNRLHPSTIDDMTAENMHIVVTSVQNVSLFSNDSLVRISPDTTPNASVSPSDFTSLQISNTTPHSCSSSRPYFKGESRQSSSPVSAIHSSGFDRLSTSPGGTVDSFIKCVSASPYKKSTPVFAPSNTGKDFVLLAPPVRPPRHIFRTYSNATTPTYLPRVQPTQPYKGTPKGSTLSHRANEPNRPPHLLSTTEVTKPTSRLNGLVNSSVSPKVRKLSSSSKEPLPPSMASSTLDGPTRTKHRLPSSLNVFSAKFSFKRSNTFHLSSGFFARQKSRRVVDQKNSNNSGSVNSSRLAPKTPITNSLPIQEPIMNSLVVQKPIAKGTRKSPIPRSFDSSFVKAKSYPQESEKSEQFDSNIERSFHPPLTRQSVRRIGDAANRRKVVIAEYLYEGGEGNDEPEFRYVPESVQQLTVQAGGAGVPLPVTPAASSPQQLKESIELLQDGLASGSLVGKFEILCRRKPGLSMDAARLPRNETRNRYRDISPYDTTRVILLNTDPSTPSTTTPTSTTAAGACSLNDYINASHVVLEIPGSNITNRYIACQGPLNSTCGHFWQMVWEQQSTLLVMLTTCIEQGRSKCHQYWPDVNSSADYGVLTISCNQQKLKPGYAVKELTVTHRKSGERRQLQHLQYLSWPDHGVPEHSTDFLTFVKQVRDIRADGASAHPTIVHCSAGIGRTGVLMLMETAQCLIEAQQPVYPLDLVQTMRDQRAMMIQTSGQFRFVCEAICRVYNEKLVEPLSKYSNR